MWKPLQGLHEYFTPTKPATCSVDGESNLETLEPPLDCDCCLMLKYSDLGTKIAKIITPFPCTRFHLKAFIACCYCEHFCHNKRLLVNNLLHTPSHDFTTNLHLCTLHVHWSPMCDLYSATSVHRQVAPSL